MEAGKVVISDRFVDSMIAYQGYAYGVDCAVLDALYKSAAGDFKPALTLILDLPVEAGLARAAERVGKETRYESKGAEFHERVRNGFKEIAKAEPKRCKVIDGRQSIEAIHKLILAEVEKIL